MTKSKKITLAVYMLAFVTFVGFITTTVFGYILGSYPQVSPTTVALLLTVPSLVGLAVSFLIGPLSLKFGKKNLLIVTYLCMLIGALLFVFTGSKSIIMLIVGAALIGICQGSYSTLQNSLIADYVPEAERATIMTMTTVFINAGSIVYNLLGGKIGAINGGASWQNAYLLALMIVPAVIIFAVLCPKDTPVASASTGDVDAIAKENDKTAKKINPYVFVICLHTGLCIAFIYSFSLNFSDYYINTLKLGTSAQTGIILSASTIGGMISGVLYKYYSKPLKAWVAPIGICLYGIFCLCCGLTHSMVGFIVCSAGMGACNTIVVPYASAAITMETQPKYIPVALSLFSGLVNGLIFLAPYMINGIAKIGVDVANTPAYMANKFIASGICLIVLSVIAVFIYPLRKKKAAA